MKRILLVDDERTFLKSLSESLMNLFKDVRVVTAENGAEALRIMNSEPINFLITDLQMPVMNGFDLLKYVKRLYPNLPVIIMTAYVSNEMMKELDCLGCLDVMEKPIEFDLLVKKIKESLYGKTVL